MRKSLLIATAVAALVASPALVLAKDPPPAKNTITVFVSKGSASSVTKEINKVHAKMEADGWVYRDMGVYTEDGDLEGIFVTYVRPQPTGVSAPAPEPAPMPAPMPAPTPAPAEEQAAQTAPAT
jgi:hypothetical protein